ncbi:class I SAM-dependent methyltransferase [Ornithinimicrobium cerasi]|uniref:Methyltransferase domain-containing protein n=1 Tax=Ornithinimicrobium cerasi TaxID=2248773 RepID=A0A285VW77_9MICO|nr:class I SAM-dependent methyltransferase [Ornithinimicrobium cerasi]SOC57506.1 Methyltransferase domain-containing protein [Ornithinimicrobium cerasi]SOC57568.1 Methyltransferase domain-containing protein [Ornithinimicrobium cerasi]
MTQAEWDRAAATFDDEPDHGLASPTVREAWRRLLTSVLPPAPAQVADLGCGTGTLTRLLTDEGYAVDGLDLSPRMIERARLKVPGARFVVGDASAPALAAGGYDVVLSRHVLWALPDPRAAFARWVDLLQPGGTVVLVEGRWSTGAGLTAAQTEQIVRSHCEEVQVTHLTDPVYWGRPITDERYLIVARRSGPAPAG